MLRRLFHSPENSTIFALPPRLIHGNLRSALRRFQKRGNYGIVQTVERYLAGRNIAFKVLLLIGNASGHPGNLSVAYPNVEMILPPNTTSLIEALNQGLILTLKAYYTICTFCHILDAIDTNPELTVGQCWKKFNVAHCISTIKESLHEVKDSTINICWHNLWPQAVKYFRGFRNNMKEKHKIVRWARQVGIEGFDDMEPEELDALIDLHAEQLYGNLPDSSQSQSSSTLVHPPEEHQHPCLPHLPYLPLLSIRPILPLPHPIH
uniref:DDE-1 domain-containing protein n=1 Tax=Eptatretus burgeri TaxID=7764 RepID=A0A8C4NEX6_EPTBU